jgi:hypothetical protein
MSKMLRLILPLLAVLLLGSSAAIAGGGGNTITYPEKNPIFTVTFPDDWSTETDENLLHAVPSDSSLYLGIWALEDANTLDAALDEVDKAVSSLVKNLKVDDADSMDVNGIKFITVDGTGKDDDGNNVSVSVALFSPDEKQIFIMLYYGAKDAEDVHEKELVGILKSINGEK